MVTKRPSDEKLSEMIKFLGSRTTNALPHGGLADSLYADALISINEERKKKEMAKNKRKALKEIRRARELLADGSE
jgi:hypothetical protein